jgi:hypothetical protein
LKKARALEPGEVQVVWHTMEIHEVIALGCMIGIDWREITQGVALGCLLVVPSALEEGSGVVSGYRWPSSDPE